MYYWMVSRDKIISSNRKGKSTDGNKCKKSENDQEIFKENRKFIEHYIIKKIRYIRMWKKLMRSRKSIIRYQSDKVQK